MQVPLGELEPKEPWETIPRIPKTYEAISALQDPVLRTAFMQLWWTAVRVGYEGGRAMGDEEGYRRGLNEGLHGRVTP